MSFANNPTVVKIIAGFGLKSLNAELALLDLPKARNAHQAAKLVLGMTGVRSQGEFTALVVNLTEGEISPDQVTELLKSAFPTKKIGIRHGPHWICHVRNGNINGYQGRFYPPKGPERKAAAKLEVKISGYATDTEFRTVLQAARDEADVKAKSEATE